MVEFGLVPALTTYIDETLSSLITTEHTELALTVFTNLIADGKVARAEIYALEESALNRSS